MSTPEPTSTEAVPELAEYARQEIRIAAVLNGGVSLAVWISGVVIELHHLALASQGLGPWRTYREVLDLLGADARIDVVSGTSAGGLNGAFLALALARRRDLTLLRDLWADDASLDALLRPALDKNPPSLLRGDDYFLERMRSALRATISTDNPDLGDTDTPAAPRVELILTGTLWSGRTSTFTDDMGVSIAERDYDATFRFASRVPTELAGAVGDLDDRADRVIEQLARAARCTSSFPAAFEPHLVTRASGPSPTRRWATSAGQANFVEEQYVLDGGILLNKPVRPALEAIYRQNGENQVRRVLAYVVPDPGEPPRAPDGGVGPVPLAGDVVLGILTRLRSTDSVSRELAEIRERNAAARERRRSRARISVAMAAADEQLSHAMWDGYVSERIDDAAASIGHLIAAGQGDGSGAWSERELTDALLRHAAGPAGFRFVPQTGIATALVATGADWSWGQTAVTRLMDMTVDLLRRGLTLAPMNSPAQETLVATRRGLDATVRAIQADQADLTRFWLDSAGGARGLPPIPPRRGGANTSATNVADLDAWLDPVLQAWDETPVGPQPADGDTEADPGGGRRTRQHGQALALARAVYERRREFADVCNKPNAAMDPTGGERAQLSALHSWLLAPATSPQDVLERMLRLDVVLVATAGTLAQVEQEVELVQVSCSDRNVITGMQLHHFGAFYRAPWRVNDWIQGRLDGARQSMRFLLSPERLRQRGFTTATLMTALERIAVPADDGRDRNWLSARWEANREVYEREVAAALTDSETTSALDEVARALALPLQLQILRDDLATMARVIRAERSDAPQGSAVWLASYQAKLANAGPAPAAGPESAALSADQAWALRAELAEVGSQKLADDVGSDTFARTVSHAATVTASVVGAPPKIGKVRAVRFVLSALRGYTAMLWVMVSYVTRGSEFGTRVVNLAVAAGGALVATAIFVPSVPIGLTLLGVGLVLAGTSAAALRTRGGVGLGIRLLVAFLLVAGALTYLIWREIDRDGFGGDAFTILVKLGVGLLIVLLGWFLATAGSSPKPPEQRAAPSRAGEA